MTLEACVLGVFDLWFVSLLISVYSDISTQLPFDVFASF